MEISCRCCCVHARRRSTQTQHTDAARRRAHSHTNTFTNTRFASPILSPVFLPSRFSPKGYKRTQQIHPRWYVIACALMATVAASACRIRQSSIWCGAWQTHTCTCVPCASICICLCATRHAPHRVEGTKQQRHPSSVGKSAGRRPRMPDG